MLFNDFPIGPPPPASNGNIDPTPALNAVPAVNALKPDRTNTVHERSKK